MWFPIFPEGTRVRIQRGAQPLEPEMIGRTGLVIQTDLQRRERYGVIFDGEDRVRTFREDELAREEGGVKAEVPPTAAEPAGDADEEDGAGR